MADQAQAPGDFDFKIDTDLSVIDHFAPQPYETERIVMEEELAVEAPKQEADVLSLLADEFEAPDFTNFDLNHEPDEFIILHSPGKPTA